ncbi:MULTISPECIES: oxygenase MpaB family protein [Rhodococcus]|uniref:Oxygenase MpaB family protein n=1 Tax=Rhodococcus oxybenzonivorans TaxID=1990687 RepID=A0AAE4UX15_9NOCA|nr:MULTISPECIES: oxygenase MpaB family protein [Rhodococcus]MDV7243655.1 oxygenase MpaB family protein [Rhodococcus oxybenzonivorans]MDV7264282.1 oxygenase MpaB family protein [Rhodococcus oxybenzonivorans]MDV7275103.1 oxygenase MpaB family protein [Rhodococcus oxybenzonivorans]MDV7335341.1 oxygenase MpaB family protein [Rhodococcus oxybenzonivorans]MDV7346052.1 oxygenase MpaB family protein [Rhodococcus oxybenzonivorans]
MTATTETPRREGALDVPEGLPRGIDLGRINNRDRAIAMYGREFAEKLTDHALLADDAAYRAMRDFRDKSTGANWRTFDTALEHGIDALDDPPAGMVELFRQLDHIPDWVDFDQLYRGAVAFWRAGPIVPPILAWATIAGGFSMYSATRPVLFSGRLRKADHVGTRLVESFRYVVAAYTPGGMGRFEEGFRLTAKVRMIHAAVRHGLSRSDAWDWENWGIPINNLDSMVTQAGQFGVKFLDAVHSSGIRFTDREIEDIFALSRYVGWVIGVPEDILHTDYDDARKKTDFHTLVEQPADDLCRDVVHSVIKFSVENPPGDVEVLPAPVAKFMTTDRRLKLAYGMLSTWLPASVIKDLHIEPTPWRFVLPAVKPLLTLSNRVGRILPHDDEAATFRILKQFNAAIAVPESEKAKAVANPDEVGADAAANKGGMPVVAKAG